MDENMNNKEKNFYTMEVLKHLLQSFGRDFVTEDLIRDTKKIVEELFVK